MDDKGTKGAGPNAVAIGIAALTSAWGMVASIKARKSAREARMSAQQARQSAREATEAREALKCSGAEVARLKHHAERLAEQYRQAQDAYTALLQIQGQAEEVRSTDDVQRLTLHCMDQHSLT